jgi:hypothetical protein
MTTRPNFEDRLANWLEDGPADAPDQILETVLAAIPSIPQRRAALRVPWRNPLMNGYARALAGIAAVVAIAVGALLLIPRSQSSNVGGAPSASPSTSAVPSSSPIPSSTPINLSSWISFSSTRHGYRISHPSDWTVLPATAPWPPGTDAASPPDPMLDVFTGPAIDSPTFVVASQPLPQGVTGNAWLTNYEQSGAARFPASCWPAVADMETAVVGGQPAWIHGDRSACGFTEAVVIVGGRVYALTGYPHQNDLAPDGSLFDRALFDAFLSTVQLDPGSADDRPVASPTSS